MLRLGAIGLGNRACKYLKYLELNPGVARLCAAADPDRYRCRRIARRFSLPDGCVFSSAEDLFASGHELDAVIIASPDRTHFGFAMQAVERGWAVLLEKPVATTLEECMALERAAAAKGVTVAVCYVLRFYPLYAKIREIVSSGALGRIVSVRHRIDVGADRMTHTFVRGLWAREEDSSPILLSKAVHDIDILCWIAGEKAVGAESSGGLVFFRRENAPEGSAERCADCAEEKQCPYSAADLYLRRNAWNEGFEIPPGGTKTDAVMRELVSGRYGRCVFRCDNDVADRQSVRMMLESGAEVRLELDGTGPREGRRTVILCEKGSVATDGNYIKVRRSGERKCEVFDMSGYSAMPLHGGADLAAAEDFIEAVSGNRELRGADISSAVCSHGVCFMAEESRKLLQNGKL